jgi:hypothetical protein
MEQVTLGKTGLRVSPLGMGVIPISRLSEQEGLAAIRAVADLGITWFDTARGYEPMESRLGAALEGHRREVILITKAWTRDPTELRAHIEESLRRLRTDCIDIFLLHQGKAILAEAFQGPGGLLQILTDAVQAGKIRFLGFSAHRPEIAMAGLKVEAFSVAMVPASLVAREFTDGDFMPEARRRGFAVLAMKPFGGGRIENVTLALRHLKRYGDVWPLIGIERPAQMAENLRIWESATPIATADETEIARIQAELGTRFCRGCGYCMPCPQGIEIWPMGHAAFYARQLPRDDYIQWYLPKVAKAKECVECRQCVEKCPYGLEIPEMLRESVAFFEAFVAARS